MPSLMGFTGTIDSGFTPSGSPVGHWSADTITGLEDGDPVGTWPDQSGNGNDLTQATAANKPTYKTNELNGLPGVKAITDDGFTISINSMNECSYHFVAKKWQAAHSSGKYARIVALGGTNYGVLTYQDGSNEWAYYNSDKGWPGGILGGISTNWSLVTIVETLTVGNGWINGTNTLGNFDPADFNAQTALDVFWSPEGATPGDYTMCELVLYNSAISTADRETNESGLNTKWAVY